MEITARELCYLLARNQDLCVKVPRTSDPIIKSVHIWHSQEPHENIAYIVQEDDPVDYIVKHGATAVQAKSIIKPEDAASFACDALLATATWDGRLKDLVYTGCTSTELLDLGAELIPELLNIVTNDLRIIGSVSNKLEQRFGVERNASTGRANFTDETIDELMMMDNYSQAARIRGVFFYPYERSASASTRYICGNIFHESASRARLVASRPDDFSEDETDGLVLIFRHYLGYVQMAYSNQWVSGSKVTGGDTLRQVLKLGMADETRMSRNSLIKAAKLYGWNLDAYYLVTCASFFEEALWKNLGARLCERLEEEVPGSCAVANGERFIWICDLSHAPFTEEGEIIKRLVVIARDFTFRAGVSRKFRGISLVPEGIREAWCALEVGNDKSPYIWYHRFEDCVREYIYNRMTSELPAEMLVHPCIERLEDYDRLHGTEYMQTLRCYFDCGFNVSEAAKRINVHHTTFSRRLAHIKEASGYDPWNPQTRLDLMLSFWLLSAAREMEKQG